MEKRKFLIILQAGKESHEGQARALHTFLYAKELKENGHEARIVFDGAGTEWAAELEQGNSRMKALYEEAKKEGAVTGVCKFCSEAFSVKEKVPENMLEGKYMNHPSIAEYVEKGYEPLVL